MKKDILKTQYSEDFDNKRKNAIVVSYHKYGDARKNFAEGRVDALASALKKLSAYKRTGNTEYLVDVANYIMFEYLYPSHPNAHYASTDDDKRTEPVGVPINYE